MENQVPNQAPQQINTLLPVPNATPVLVLGILSIVFCWCYGIIGLALGIIALVLSSKGMSAYKAAPENYTKASYNNAKAGKICAIIGVSLSALYLTIILIYLIILGSAISMIPWEIFDTYSY